MPSPGREDMPLQRLGATIRHYRRQQKIPLTTFATLTGLDKTYLSEIERGRRNVSVLSLLRIAQALHLPFSHLVAPLDTYIQPAPPSQEDSF
jgi:transcriptional regulator with XRE-family HTH domain